MFLEDQNDEDFAQNKLQILAGAEQSFVSFAADQSFFWKIIRVKMQSLKTCIELITQAIAGGHKILLFSQFNVLAGSYWREIKKRKNRLLSH